jgi:antirestriction protein
MNTEKIEKLKKSLSNSKLPADLKPKIEAEIKRLESLDAKQEVKEEAKEEAKEVVAKKPRAKRVATKKATAKPSQTRKPKRTAMSLAKEIRKEGESWNDARARASKMMKEETKTVTKKVESELDKLSKLVRSKKELRGQVGKTNLLIDAKRKAKPMGRRVSKDGNVYYENRANRTDRGTYGKYHLAEGAYLMKGLPENFKVEIGESEYTSEKGNGVNYYGMILYKGYTFKFFSPYNSKKDVEDSIKRYLKSLSVSNITLDNSPEKGDYSVYYTDRNGVHLHTEDSKEDLQEFIKDVNKLKKSYAEGGYLTDGTFGNFQNQVFNDGGAVTNERRYVNKGEDYEVRYSKPILRRKGYDGKRDFELGGVMATDLAGHTGGGDAGLNAGMPLDGFSNTAYTGLVGETGAMSSGEMFEEGGALYSAYTDNPLKYLSLMGALTYGDLNYSTSKNGIDYYIGRKKDKYGDIKAIVVAFITDENNYMIDKEDAKEMSETAREKGVDKVELYTNYGVELRSTQKPQFLGFDKIVKVRGNYELGGGLPQGAEQSYMITEALGNPAQHFATGGGVGKMYYHILEYGDYGNIGYQGYYDTLEEAQKQVKKLSDYFPNQTFQIFADKSRKEPPITTMAKGGGVRRINGKEYSYGRNWTNDHEHTNKSEEHEVNYTRKGKFLGVFNDGGDFQSGVYATGGGVADNVKYMKDMMKSLYTYGGIERGSYGFNKYLLEYEDILGKKLFDKTYNEELKNLQEYEILQNTSTDSEGLTYNSLKRKMATGGGVEDDSPKIYVADLEAYNNGRLSGVWLDLTDYSDADVLMGAINNFLKTTGGEEYAIHDVENIPNSMYSEYMGQKDFEELYEMIDLSIEHNLPLSVVQEVVSQYDASAVDEFYGKYNNAEDFAQQLVDDVGIESFTDFEYYLYITDTDRRLLSQDMADSYVDDIKDEDGGNRLIEEAGLDVEEYEEAESDRQEEMLDEAREIVYDEYYNNWMEGLSDPYYFLVEEQGMYDAESFANANFVRIDFEKLADALEQDYTYIYDNASLYVFNIR